MWNATPQAFLDFVGIMLHFQSRMPVLEKKNVVPIPTLELENALIQSAVPGFTGSVSIEVVLMASAGQEVQLTVRRKQNHLVQLPEHTTEKTAVIPSNDRINRVKLAVSELAPRFTLSTPILGFRANFLDGVLRSIETEDQPL